MFDYKKTITNSLLFSCVIIFTSCTTNPIYQNDKSISDSSTNLALNKSKKVKRLDILFRQYKNKSIVESNDTILEILTASVNEGEWDVTENVLKVIDTDNLNLKEFIQYNIDASQYYIDTKQFEIAKKMLLSPKIKNNLNSMSNSEKVNILLLRAKVLYATGEIISSLSDRVLLSEFIINIKQKKYNHRKIWETVSKIPQPTREKIIKKNGSNIISGWLTLASIHSDYMSGKEKQLINLKKWKLKWPNHPANSDLPSDIKVLFVETKKVNEIALLIPLSGSLKKAGDAVQEGIFASYFNALEKGWDLPVITTFDTNENSISTIHEKIRQSNTDLIIGPLKKESLSQLAKLETQTPIIALNYLNNKSIINKNITQFGLASEDEAEQLAIEAIENGHKNAIILQTNFDWAHRASDSFEKKWNKLGGKIINHTVLTDENKYSDQIEKVLSLSNSQLRHDKIEKLLDKQLGFSPRRRQDFDVFIIFSNNDQIHTIKPLLDYHYSSEIKVYGSSHINDSLIDKNYRDLNGVIFNEMPWILASKDNFSSMPRAYHKNKQLQRLFALGMDAFYLHNKLDELKYSSENIFPGRTGHIYLEKNRLARELDMANYKRGVIEVLPLHSY